MPWSLWQYLGDPMDVSEKRPTQGHSAGLVVELDGLLQSCCSVLRKQKFVIVERKANSKAVFLGFIYRGVDRIWIGHIFWKGPSHRSLKEGSGRPCWRSQLVSQVGCC